ncbi:MAG: prepilin-type N-terminal cleavage/methylation domain-containing protein [Planctomycetes bacterium]|nr:prepilin-type N-terminal cleavage/methylation domain-containing protein [Planctomycetota bacterium]
MRARRVRDNTAPYPSRPPQADEGAFCYGRAVPLSDGRGLGVWDAPNDTGRGLLRIPGRGRPGSLGGFSLVELLVTTVVLGILLAVLLPTIANARKQTRRVVCLSNQRQIALAMLAYTQDNRDRFPIAQYFDHTEFAWVTWDTITYLSDPSEAKPGLIWQYIPGHAVQQCPSYRGPSMTSGDPYTGYNYNTTYIGRGEGEGSYLGMDEAPAQTSDLRRPARTALIGDGGYVAGANKFMRAPLDTGVSESTVHAGGQAYRHADKTNVMHVDGHGEPVLERFRKPGAAPWAEPLMDFPRNGFLGADDRHYSRW